MSVSVLDPLAVPTTLPVRHLSHSSLALFWRCPERWRRRYVLGEHEPLGAPAALGGAVGAALAAHLAARQRGQRLSLADTDDLFCAEWAQRAPTARFAAGEPGALLRRQGRQLVVAYLHRLAPLLRPEAVERRVELRFDADPRWSVLGYLDVEDAAGEVIDLKVRGRHVSPADADQSAQATLYLLARALEGRPAKRFVFHSLRRTRKGADLLAVPTRRTQAQLAAFERRIAATARAIARCADLGEWPLAAPEGWWCAPGPTGCPHYQTCPGGLAQALPAAA
jgi:hypothetical protein